MRRLPILAQILLITCATTIATAYITLRNVGINVTTTRDAFVAPAIDQPTSRTAKILDLTPAPWPHEAALIYRWTSIGVPVNIEVSDTEPPVRFSVSSVDREGHLVISDTENPIVEAAVRAVISTEKIRQTKDNKSRD